MQLYILNEQYDIIGMIDVYESVLWQKKYNDVGECEIFVSCEPSHLELLKRGYYVYRFDDDMFCKIEDFNVQTSVETDDHIIATANDVLNLLSDRIVQKRITFSGKVADFIHKVVTDNVITPTNRNIPNLRIDTTNFAELTETIESDIRGDDVLKVVLAACKSANFGIRMSFDIVAREYVLRLYKGKNKASPQSTEYIEFSPQFENILSSNYRENEIGYKNVACVAYTETGEEELMHTVYEGAEPKGEKRKEVFVDGTSIKRERTIEELTEMFPDVELDTGVNLYYAKMNGVRTAVATRTIIKPAEEGKDPEIIIKLTDVVFFGLLKKQGMDVLYQHKKTLEYKGEVDTQNSYRYKIDYDLGDVVKVINEYGIETEAQITGIMESDDVDNGYAVEPHFEYFN